MHTASCSLQDVSHTQYSNVRERLLVLSSSSPDFSLQSAATDKPAHQSLDLRSRSLFLLLPLPLLPRQTRFIQELRLGRLRRAEHLSPAQGQSQRETRHHSVEGR